VQILIRNFKLKKKEKYTINENPRGGGGDERG
jgi:hypothetical protein